MSCVTNNILCWASKIDIDCLKVLNPFTTPSKKEKNNGIILVFADRLCVYWDTLAILSQTLNNFVLAFTSCLYRACRLIRVEGLRCPQVFPECIPSAKNTCDFLDHMYKAEPQLWVSSESGKKKTRVLTDFFAEPPRG